MVAPYFKQMVDTGKYGMYHYMCHVLRANDMPWECHIAIGEFMEELDARSKRPQRFLCSGGGNRASGSD